MGTRADFYIGRGVDAEWLGSIAWDGYPSGLDDELLKARTRQAFLHRFKWSVANREDFTAPEQGWPWPWDTSSTTDYAYAFDADRVWMSCFGHKWQLATSKREPPDEESAVFPNMAERQNVAFGKRSGLIVIGG